MDSTTEALTPKLNPMGLLITIVAGAVAAGVMGFVYHLVANKAGIDYIIALAAIMGAVVGFVVGQAARMGGLRALLVVTLVAFVFGVAGYAARYFFEYNDQIESAVQEVAADAEAAGVTLDEVRAFMLEGLAQEYPPGGLFGYLQFVAESGFSIGSRGSATEDAPIQGGLAWGLLAVETLAAGLVAAGTARGIVRRAQTAVSPGGPADGVT
jgi:uncharacterized membrane protein YeaQ/YmgE (transglycosylase-associated protein family)